MSTDLNVWVGAGVDPVDTEGQSRVGMDGGWRAPLAAALAVLGSTLALPGGAWAATAPRITEGPVIDGSAQVGSTVTATATWEGDPAPVASYTWLRCPRPSGSCSAIDGASTANYQVTAADLGFVLRVRLTVTNAEGSADKRSAPTTAVVAAPPPVATPTPIPTPAPTAEPQPTFDVVATPAPTPPAPPRTSASAPQMLTPFPIVRIKGVMIATGARVTRLRVTAPRGVRISVTCRGRDCPVRRYVAPPGVRRLRRFERDLAAGTRLQVIVSKPGFIGKSTVIVIRRFAAPRRTDRCLPPGAARVVRCPAA